MAHFRVLDSLRDGLPGARGDDAREEAVELSDAELGAYPMDLVLVRLEQRQPEVGVVHAEVVLERLNRRISVKINAYSK